MTIKYILSKIIKKYLLLSSINNSDIHKSSRICAACNVQDTILGRYSYIGSYCTVVNTKIGSFCSIADNCIIGGASHPLNWVSTSPIFYDGHNVMGVNLTNNKYTKFKETIIGNDVWIGSNSLIKGGVTIANGAVIAMGSIVTKDVDPYAIVAGNPAKLIRLRFDENTVSKLLSSKWWDLSDYHLRMSANTFTDVYSFIEHFNKEYN